MRKKIQIILKKNYLNIGKKGKIAKISQGYAINYLIPNDIAEIATKNKIKHINMFENIKIHKIKANEFEAKNLQKYLNTIKKFSTKRKIGENNNIFGSINEKDISNIILNYTGINIDKKQIIIPNIKKIGVFNININILNKISSIIILNVIPENI
uniref:50S ribosomal protein L9, chloroplastic n=1 Tax=Erythroglossum lusitanicum TaxID=2575615 RepID=A0A4D6WV25_9FLOR|nr:ribosomal protein L9 [Erythroglossum lusitanicum]